jgi:hypothetical protein
MLEILPLGSCTIIYESPVEKNASTTRRRKAALKTPVCYDCNHGWMSRLESKAKPLISQMVLHRIHNFTASQQRTLAQWATMKALLWPFAMPNGKRLAAQTIPEPWRRAFQTQLRFPPSTHVWAASFEGGTIVNSLAATFEREVGGGEGGKLVGYYFAVVIDKMVLHVAVPGRDNIRIQSSDPNVSLWSPQVWPVVSDRLPWPPRYNIDVTMFELLPRMFVPVNKWIGPKPISDDHDQHL